MALSQDNVGQTVISRPIREEMDYPKAVSELIGELKLLPAVGPRSAERIALWLLMDKRRNPISLAEALVQCERDVDFCLTCGFFTTGSEPCEICSSSKRQRGSICVVERAPDVMALERSDAFKGLYHCLGGLLSPLDGVHPEDLKIDSLLKRVDDLGDDPEVILAISSNVEGDATASYIADLLIEKEVKVTRLARGLPVGANLEFTDQLTLARAFEGRKS